MSGRPGDALVMLKRLAAMGVVTDAATNNDFERVRALPGWAELEGKTSGTTPSPAAVTIAPPKAAAPPKPEPATAETPRYAADARYDRDSGAADAEGLARKAECG